MTTILFIAIIIGLTLFPCYLLRQMKINQQALAESEQARRHLEELIEFPAATKAKVAQEANRPSTQLVIEINDPVGLAKREQPFTKYLSQVAPDLIIKKVYEQVASEVALGLKEKQVDATITITKQ